MFQLDHPEALRHRKGEAIAPALVELAQEVLVETT
jgi:hypothetical protein